MNLVKIKGYSRYLISKDGVVKNVKRNEILEGSVNGSGYLQYRLTNDMGITVTWGIHRLLAWVFIAKFGNIDGLVINHKDGDKLNNDLDNLEIVTYQENSEHAGLNGLSEKCKPISVRNTLNGSVTKYPSIISFSRECGLTKDVISARCQRDEEYIYSDLNQYKFGHSEFIKPLSVNKIELIMHTGRSKPVVLRNVMTGEITEFNQSEEVAKYLNCSCASISKWLRDESQPIVTGFYQLQSLKDLKPWIDHKDVISRSEKDNKVRCVYGFKDEWMLFYSAKEAALYLDITTTSLDYRLKSKGLTKFKDGTSCAYYSDWSPLVERLVG